MNRPSSTITFAALAGMAVSLLWQLVETFTDIEVSAGLIAASTVFVAAAIGYYKKENVLPIAKR